MGEYCVHKVFVDPSGRHIIATIRNVAGAAETHYLHSRWKKSRPLNRLRGMLINAVAWNKVQVSDVSTSAFVVATSAGQLFEVWIDEKDKKEKYARLVYELQDKNEPFCGVQAFRKPLYGDRFLEVRYVYIGKRGQIEILIGATVDITLAEELYLRSVADEEMARCMAYISKIDLATPMDISYVVPESIATRVLNDEEDQRVLAVFSRYSDKMPKFTELPGELPNSEVHFSGKLQRRCERFAWMSAVGIYHGHLNLINPHSYLAMANDTEDNVVESKWLLEYSKLSEGAGAAQKPLSMAVTEYHFLLLYPDKLQISVHDEERDMWCAHLDRKEYAAALSFCRDALQRDRVYAAQAEAAFAAGDYQRAASFYAKTSEAATFEEIVLKFISVGEQESATIQMIEPPVGVWVAELRTRYLAVSEVPVPITWFLAAIVGL
ncbi:hypothetical protein CBR_g40703 [Chara braunii]|uniref:Pep3/Vps18 beta-propeller domain-containing protein n=1 Tax=Chara braunii TaxID=69332 RepID=A0A388LUF6_CHABU|nr:hypothetical protein CBR_g40703 [Chara braunii]|eukprot:GBG85891.1 hypothetical protein CBR_g40703 [Chara braunii]